jgi:hypothetical protein
MTVATMKQYQMEERSLINHRIKASASRVAALFEVMKKDNISSPEKVRKLRSSLAYHHKTKAFDHCNSMGSLVFENLKLLMEKDFRQSSSIYKLVDS